MQRGFDIKIGRAGGSSRGRLCSFDVSPLPYQYGSGVSRGGAVREGGLTGVTSEADEVFEEAHV